MKLYHGSPAHGIKSFSVEIPRYEGVEGSGVYLTPLYKLARGYAGSEGVVYQCSIKGPIFDATSRDEFQILFERGSNLIGFDLSKLEFFDETINGMVEGSYKVSNDQGSGINWQIRNLLYNDETFQSLVDAEEKLTKLEEYIEEYITTHSAIKYNDLNLGLVIIAKDPAAVQIIDQFIVGSDDDERHL